MLQKVEVKKLFGVFDHIIQFKEEGITIILGENGLGKTVLLKLIKFLFEHNLEGLGQVEFEHLRFFFKGGLLLTIEKTTVKDVCKLDFVLFKGNKKQHDFQHILSSPDDLSLNNPKYKATYWKHFLQTSSETLFSDDARNIISHYLPENVKRIGSDIWLEESSSFPLTTKDLIKRYSNQLPTHIINAVLNGINLDIPVWLLNLTGKVNPKLIETQRLLYSAEEDRYTTAVTRFSTELVDMIKKVRSEANDVATKLDRTYPNRLIKLFSKKRKSKDVYVAKEALINLQDRRLFLKNAGVLDYEEENLMSIDDTISDNPELATVLQIYIEDSIQKLSIYNDLASKIEMFRLLINNRFKHKVLIIDRQTGFQFYSHVKKKIIPLSGLSSGEQHLFVLFFELIFKTNEQSMLLIDEPEISLHISWQKDFIQDLSQIIKLNRLNLVIATHSPDIIGNFWGLTTTLKGIN